MEPAEEAISDLVPEQKVVVGLRVRPLSSTEKKRNDAVCVEMDGPTTMIRCPEVKEKNNSASPAPAGSVSSFTYDFSLDSMDVPDANADQESVYKAIGAPVLKNALNGFNGCLFAYGQTGSGKTYSMMGSPDAPGIIPRLCEELFASISAEPVRDGAGDLVSATVEVSYLEIYQEHVKCLLDPKKDNLRVREHPATGPYVDGLTKLLVDSYENVAMLLERGGNARHTAATQMNAVSSRSHAIVILYVTIRKTSELCGKTVESSMAARVNLVDLAGSERAKKTGATGDRLAEGAQINKSLSVLGQVIHALSSTLDKGKKAHVPFRDSVLTYILKDNLGGNSKTCMLATVSPAAYNWDETLGTARYADRAKRITLRAVVNEDENSRVIRELRAEVARLQSELLSQRAAPVAEAAPQQPVIEIRETVVEVTKIDDSAREEAERERALRQEQESAFHSLKKQLEQTEKLLRETSKTLNERDEERQRILEEMNARAGATSALPYVVQLGLKPYTDPREEESNPESPANPFDENTGASIVPPPYMANTMLHFLRDGVTRVGSAMAEGGEATSDQSDASSGEDVESSRQEIIVHDPHVADLHCMFESKKSSVRLFPVAGAAVFVNGKAKAPNRSGIRLNTGDRIGVGETIFVFVPAGQDLGAIPPTRFDLSAATAELLEAASLAPTYTSSSIPAVEPSISPVTPSAAETPAVDDWQQPIDIPSTDALTAAGNVADEATPSPLARSPEPLAQPPPPTETQLPAEPQSSGEIQPPVEGPSVEEMEEAIRKKVEAEYASRLEASQAAALEKLAEEQKKMSVQEAVLSAQRRLLLQKEGTTRPVKSSSNTVYNAIPDIIERPRKPQEAMAELLKWNLVFIGHEEVGKTSLRKCLLHEPSFFERKQLPPVRSTIGIEMREHRMTVNKNRIDIVMIDLAGQECYSTHLFFIPSRRTTFVFVYNLALPLDELLLHKWLEAMQSRAPGSGVFLIGTHMDADSPRLSSERSLRSLLQNIEAVCTRYLLHIEPDDAARVSVLGSFAVSCKSRTILSEPRRRGITKFKHLMEHFAEYAVQRAKCDAQYPSGLVPVRYLQLVNAVLDLRRRAVWSISGSSFKTLAQSLDSTAFEDSASITSVTQLLDSWNVLTHFGFNHSLHSVIFTDPAWVSGVAAAVFSYVHYKQYGGKTFEASTEALRYNPVDVEAADPGDITALGVLTVPVAKVLFSAWLHDIRQRSANVGIVLNLLENFGIVFPTSDAFYPTANRRGSVGLRSPLSQDDDSFLVVDDGAPSKSPENKFGSLSSDVSSGPFYTAESYTALALAANLIDADGEPCDDDENPSRSGPSEQLTATAANQRPVELFSSAWLVPSLFRGDFPAPVIQYLPALLFGSHRKYTFNVLPGNFFSRVLARLAKLAHRIYSGTVGPFDSYSRSDSGVNHWWPTVAWVQHGNLRLLLRVDRRTIHLASTASSLSATSPAGIFLAGVQNAISELIQEYRGAVFEYSILCPGDVVEAPEVGTQSERISFDAPSELLPSTCSAWLRVGKHADIPPEFAHGTSYDPHYTVLCPTCLRPFPLSVALSGRASLADGTKASRSAAVADAAATDARLPVGTVQALQKLLCGKNSCVFGIRVHLASSLPASLFNIVMHALFSDVPCISASTLDSVVDVLAQGGLEQPKEYVFH